MKRIAIIGGGISGLAALHYLTQRFGQTADITLYERNASVGGTIGTLEAEGCLFETGPNGFLTNQPNTLDFLNEIGFADQLIEADPKSKRRYIQMNGHLHLLPMDPINFIKSPLLSTREKIRLICGLFLKNLSTDQSIYEYTSKRFGTTVTERFIDPFISGIYAGNIKQLHMASAFPKFSALKGKGKKTKTRMCSFKRGMGSLMDHLYHRYQAHIKLSSSISNVNQVEADHVLCCVPSYVAAQLLGIDQLNEVVYSSVAVVGLIYDKNSFTTLPDGFGYLIPSSEGKDVLGVLLESNVFPDKGTADHLIIRVMLGGANHPAIVNDTQEQLLAKAKIELKTIYGVSQEPVHAFIRLWPKGIPQFDLHYPLLRKQIDGAIKQNPRYHLCANYLDGISFNDCINNAKSIARDIVL